MKTIARLTKDGDLLIAGGLTELPLKQTFDTQAEWESGTLTDLVAENGKLRLQMYASFYDDITDAVDENVWEIASGVAVADGANLKVGSMSAQYSQVFSVDEFAFPATGETLIMEFKAKIAATVSGYVGIALRDVDEFGGPAFFHKFGETVTFASINGITSGAAQKLDAKYTDTCTFKIVLTSSMATFYIDGVQKAQLSHSLTGNAKIIARAYDANTYTYLDWIKITSSYKPSGTWIGPPLILDAITEAAGSLITRTATLPAGTSAKYYAAVTSDETPPTAWTEQTPEGAISVITPGGNYSGKYLWLKIDLATTDYSKTPEVDKVEIEVDADIFRFRSNGDLVIKELVENAETTKITADKKLYLKGNLTQNYEF